jgi:hypothetical protein
MAYKIVRYFQDPAVSNRVIERGVSLEQAQAHCSDPESSSETCQKPHNKARTRKHGPWFDGFTKE